MEFSDYWKRSVTAGKIVKDAAAWRQEIRIEGYYEKKNRKGGI
jgi:hypothetical protein